MWIGSIKVIVETKDTGCAATSASVRAAILRNGNELRVLRDPRGPVELERAGMRTYLLPLGPESHRR